MVTEVEQGNRLVKLLEERDAAYARHTDVIIDVIGPTVLSALIELFEVPIESISWLEIQVSENILVVTSSVTYNPNENIPRIVSGIQAEAQEDETSTSHAERLVRVGIPVELIFSPKERIIAFLTNILETGIAQRVGGGAEPSTEFDPSQLTRDQISQFLYMQHQNKGTKH